MKATPPVPTPAQQKALDLARLSGALRRLPGGFWCGNEQPYVPHAGAPLNSPWVALGTVQACIARGWFTGESVRGSLVRAILTPAGRGLLRALSESALGTGTSDPAP